MGTSACMETQLPSRWRSGNWPPKNSIPLSIRPPCTGNRGLAGRQGRLPKQQPRSLPFVLSCCPGRLAASSLHRTSQSCPPHTRHVCHYSTKTAAAAHFACLSTSTTCIFLKHISALVPHSRRTLQPTTNRPPAIRQLQFCAVLLSRPQPAATSLRQRLPARSTSSRMVYDGHR